MVLFSTQNICLSQRVRKYWQLYAQKFCLYWPMNQVPFNTIWAVTWDLQQCGMCDQQSLRSACAYAQSDQSLGLSLEYSVTVKLLTEHHLEFLSFKGSCTGLSETTLVKIPHCWKSHVSAQMCLTTKEWHKKWFNLPKFTRKRANGINPIRDASSNVIWKWCYKQF